MKTHELPHNDIGKRIAWDVSPHLERFGTLKAFFPNGQVLIELKGGRKPEMRTVPAGEVRFVDNPS